MTELFRPAACLLLTAQLISGCYGQDSPTERAAALTGVRLIDGTGRAPIDPATLVIEGRRVSAVGPADSVDIPDGAFVLDLSGRVVIPGLINSHAHLDNGDPDLGAREQLLGQLQLYARYGVTTVQSLGDDGKTSIVVRDEQKNPTNAARLLVSGPYITPRTVEEARQTVDEYAELGVDIIKTRLEGNPNDMAPEVYRALIERAHDRGLRVAAHIFYLDDARGILQAGVDILAHSVRDQDVDAAFVEELNRRGAGYIPTLTRDLSVFVYESTPEFFEDPFFLTGVELSAVNRAQMEQLMEPARQQRTRSSRQAQDIKAALEQAKRNLKLLSEGGVTIAMGTDSGTSLGRWQGYFEHVELELMVEAGLTPMQALVAATGDAARTLHLDAVGTLEPGKQADLVVLRADPLVDIRNTRQIEAVWIAGNALEEW